MCPPIFFYRLNHSLHKLGLIRVAKVASWLVRLFFSVWIPASAQIGKNFSLGYWGLGVVIHSNTKIGDNCLVGQNVTIGRNFGDTKVPIIGDNVYIGAGSVVFGEIEIGDNVIIGSNSVVNKSIPTNAIVAGNPFKVIGNTNGKTYKELDNGKN